MNSVIVGNPSVFAIESSITQPYEGVGQRGLGFFVIHILGRTYGVRSPNATLLACSVDAVERRVARRGMHDVVFGAEPEAFKVVDAFRAAVYDENRHDERFFGMSSDEFRDTLASHEIVWAPDGDSAFDDGAHVLQFDQGTRVRLIAFKNAAKQADVARTLEDLWLSAEEYYGALEKWLGEFNAEWKNALSRE
jgi:hypothetical protein